FVSCSCIAPAFTVSLLRVRSFLSLVFRCPAPTEIDTLSLHDALPIYGSYLAGMGAKRKQLIKVYLRGKTEVAISSRWMDTTHRVDRKSTRLNSSHVKISYAVFCSKKNTLVTASHQLQSSQRRRYPSDS